MDSRFLPCFRFSFFILFLLLLFFIIIAYPVFPPGTDHAHHALLTAYFLEQKTFALQWPEGTPVNYPVLFHVLNGVVSLSGVPLYKAGFILSIALLFGSSLLFFFIVKTYSEDAAFFGAFLFCLSPTLLKYELIGLYPNVLGMALYLLMLLILIRRGFNSLKTSITCGFLFGLLLLTHGVAAITGGIIVISFLAVFCLRTPVHKRYLILFAAAAVLTSFPWSFRIVPQLIEGHHRLYSPAWFAQPESLPLRLFKEFGILFLLASGSITTVKREKSVLPRMGLIWCSSLLILSLTVWGHRFLMEAVVPASLLAGIFLAGMKRFLPVILLVAGVQAAVFSAFYMPQLVTDTSLERENLTAMVWIQDKTVEDVQVYYPILFHPLYLYVVAQRNPVNVSARSSAEEEFFPFQADSRALAQPQILRMLQERRVEYIYLSSAKALTFFGNEPFSFSEYMKNSQAFTGVYACGNVIVLQIDIGSPREGLLCTYSPV